MSKSLWRVVWGMWIGYFAAAEFRSLRSGLAHAPLSWHLRWVLGIHSHPAHKLLGKLAFWGGVTWLWDHLYHGDHG